MNVGVPQTRLTPSPLNTTDSLPAVIDGDIHPRTARPPI
jgi:hypothetical protein